MKKLLFFLICSYLCHVTAQPFSLQWERVFRGPLENSNHSVKATTVDQNNNFYFTGTRDTAISSKIFLIKYNPDGAIVFQVEYFEPYPFWLTPKSICVDANGNIFVAAWKSTSESFKFIVLKYDSLGNLLSNFSKSTTYDNSTNNSLVVKLATDQSGSLYYAMHDVDSSNNLIKLKCGKLNANGSLLWEKKMPLNYNELLGFKLRTDDKLEVSISTQNYDSVFVFLYDTASTLLSSFGDLYDRGKFAYIDENDNTYLVVNKTDPFLGLDSELVIKLDPNLNVVWSLGKNGIGTRDLINGNGSHLYWSNDSGVFRIDTSGFIEWNYFVSDYVESILVNIVGDAYVSYSLGFSRDFACFIVLDTAKNIKQLKSYIDYIYPLSALNNNSSFISGMDQATSPNYGNQVVFYDSSFTDSVFYTNVNYQHKFDIDLKSLIDHNHNIIDVCRMVDTTIYPGSFSGYPSLCISKYDSGGILNWRKNFHVTSNGYFNYINGFVDFKNNVFVCGQAPASGNVDQSGFVIKVSFDGSNDYQYMFLDSTLGGRFSINSITADKSGNIFIAGNAQSPLNTPTDAILIKFDSALNVIWKKQLRIQPAAYESAENIQLKNQNLVFTLQSSLSNVPTTYICEYDTAGNQIRIIPANSSYNQYKTFLRIDHSGNFILAGLSLPPAWYMIKLDSLGTIRCDWRDSLGYIDWNNQVNDVKIDDNDNVYLIGNISDGSSRNYCLRKFSNCNIDWTDTISGYYGSDLSLMNGQVYTTRSTGNDQLAQIIIYDSLGTISFIDSFHTFISYPITILADSNCFYTSSSIRTDSGGVAIDLRRYINLAPTIIQKIHSDNFLFVYPNPSSGKLTISINTELNTKFNLKLTDMVSQLVYSDVVFTTSGENKKEIDLGKLAKGMYFLTMEMDGVNVQSVIPIVVE